MKRALTFAITVILFTACESESEPIVYKNPSKTFRIIAFERDAKLTEPGSYNLSILSVNDSLPDARGNAFIAKSNGDTKVFIDTTCFSHWLNDSVVEVVYNPKLTIIKKDTLVNGIRLVYRLQ